MGARLITASLGTQGPDARCRANYARLLPRPPLLLPLLFLACDRVDVAPSTWATDGCVATVPSSELSLGEGELTELWLAQPDGVRLSMDVRYPGGEGCVGAVVYAPAGFDPGTGRAEESQAMALVDAGAAYVAWDPRGRVLSEGEEDANGAISQDDFAAVLRWAAGQPRVDPRQVVVYTRSFGGALASGALARDETLAPLAWVDYESPGWLRDDLEHASAHTSERMWALAEASGDENAWFKAREPAGFIGEVTVPYRRVQGTPDHALDTMQAAVAMVNGAVYSPEVTFNGVEVTEALTEESAEAGAIAGGIDPDGEAMTAAVLDAFSETSAP